MPPRPESVPTTAPGRRKRVHEILQAALARDPPERTRLLDEVGLDDPDAQQEVECLLRMGLGRGRFDALVERFASPPVADDRPRERIGAYRPVRLLGRGGMGAVHLAERADGAFDQRVAIKLLPPGTQADLHSRFLAERRILARLRHPNIARLLDGGTTEDGLPYLVLEYVEGEPLTQYCDRRRLSVEARLGVFLEVCAAVAYAHANLVIHRDIKPANVLVVSDVAGTGTPRIKLLDFGIAKLLDDESVPGDSPVTRVGLRIMTPDYAAPEQVRGDPVTTATDVYQLGVLLYELISGQRPHRLSSGTLHHIERAICEMDPAKPSVALQQARNTEPEAHEDARSISRARDSTPQRLRRRLAGDLDTIVLHALAKEPERRYVSVDALAADIRRHQRGLPVQARPDTLRYRTGKLVRRNRAAVLVGSAILLLLVVFATSTSVQAARLARERDRAERAAGFVIELFEELEPAQAPGSTVPAREILDRGVLRAHAELRAQPQLQARLLDALGRAYQLRGFYVEAEPLLREALALRTADLDPDDLQVAGSLHTLANLLVESDRHAEAAPLLAYAAAVYRRRLGPTHPRVASVEIDIALARRASGDGPAAESLLAGAVEVLRQRADEFAGDLATALLYLGKVRIERGDTETSESLLREALDIRRAAFGDEHPGVANALDGLGELMEAREDYVAAERAYRDALAVRRLVLPDDHVDVGVSLENVGIALHKQGRGAEAEALLSEALEIFRPAFGGGHPLVRVGLAYIDSVRINVSASTR